MSSPSQSTDNTSNTGSQDVFIQHQAGSDTDMATAINGAPDVATRYLMVIDGKLQYCDKSGRTYPMDTLPEAFKQWIKNECRDREKKKAYITWLMDTPLDVIEDGNPSSATLRIQELPRRVQEQYEIMETADWSKEEHIKCLIEQDIAFWVANRWAGEYSRVFQKEAPKLHLFR